jgi:small subunit ribosomal protein S20
LPVTRSAEKRMRQTITRTARNRRVKSMVKTAMRRFEEAIQSGDRELAQTRLITAIRRIDQAVAKGILHKNNAARKKSHLTRLFNQNAAG